MTVLPEWSYHRIVFYYAKDKAMYLVISTM